MKAAAFCAAALALAAALAHASTGLDCPPAFYTLADGSGVDIAPSDEGHLRWRRLDGTTGYLTAAGNGKWTSTRGWTGQSDGVVVDLANCGDGEIAFAGQPGRRLDLTVTEAQFASRGVQLAGRLVMPRGDGAVPIVVLVHGSEDSSARRFYALQRLLPAQGVGVFVYDKRGTGDSQGAYTHAIPQLAADAHRALETAAQLAGPRAGRLGYYGSSQGGWTAPAAAALGRADFVIVGYGMAVSPLDEDREALELDMTRHGFGPAEVAKAQEIGVAARTIVRANFQHGYAKLAAALALHKDEPWLPFVQGNVSSLVLAMTEAELRTQGPQMLAGLDLDYDPMPVLRTLGTPQLWLLGEDDLQSPYRWTYERLMALQRGGREISVVSFPRVGHGLFEYETRGTERMDTRQPAAVQQIIVSFAKGLPLENNYGQAWVDKY